MKEIELTFEEQLVWDGIKCHIGHKRAMTSSQFLYDMESHNSDRSFRRIVLSLRLKGKPIGSSVGNPAGYFVIKNESEMATFKDRMMLQIYANARVIKAVCGMSAKELAGQIQIALEEKE